jgi:hypothetical protein
VLLDTYDVLEPLGLLNKAAFAMAIADDLMADPVADMSEVHAKAKLIEEIRVDLCGTKLADGSLYSDDAAEEIDEMIREMTRPSNLVHHAMANGFALCSTTITRKVRSDNGVPIVVKKSGRFVAHDAAVVMQYRIVPAVNRTVNGMERLSELSADAQLRNPAIGQLMPGQLKRLHQTMQMQLPMPKKEDDGE